MSSTPTPAGGQAVSEYTRDVLELVAARIEPLVRDVDDATEVLGDPEVVAARMVATVPQPSPWADVVGPVHTTAGLRDRLGGITRQAIDDRVRRGTLFALVTADGHRVFPAFQLDDRGDPLAGLSEVVSRLREGADDWTIAGWLRHPQGELDGLSPIEWLARGRDPEPLDALARSTAARWSR